MDLALPGHGKYWSGNRGLTVGVISVKTLSQWPLGGPGRCPYAIGLDVNQMTLSCQDFFVSGLIKMLHRQLVDYASTFLSLISGGLGHLCKRGIMR